MLCFLIKVSIIYFYVYDVYDDDDLHHSIIIIIFIIIIIIIIMTIITVSLGAPLMIAMSQHLGFFTTNLYEELIKLPYDLTTISTSSSNANEVVRSNGSSGSSSNQDHRIDFHSLRVEKRCNRFKFVQHYAINYDEITMLIDIFRVTSISYASSQIALQQINNLKVSTTSTTTTTVEE